MSSWIKLTAFKIGLWPILNYINTKGKGYGFSETDGCIYSFSVFDVLDVVYEWGSKVFVIPVGKKGKQSLFHSLLTASYLLLVGIR